MNETTHFPQPSITTARCTSAVITIIRDSRTHWPLDGHTPSTATLSLYCIALVHTLSPSELYSTTVVTSPCSRQSRQHVVHQCTHESGTLYTIEQWRVDPCSPFRLFSRRIQRGLHCCIAHAFYPWRGPPWPKFKYVARRAIALHDVVQSRGGLCT